MNLMTRPLARGTVRGGGLNIKLESPLAVPKGHARDLQRPLRLPPAASAAASCTPQRAPGGGACSAQRRVGTCKASASLAASLVGPGDTWAVWSLLLACGSFGLWAERTKWGAALSGPLVSTLAALALSNLGVLPPSAPAYSIVTGYLLPLAVPLLLFAADLRRVVRETGRLLGAFALGAAGTILGTAVAGFALRGPLAALGEDAWKMAAALCARHIGGAVNFVAVGEYLSASPSLMAAGLAADNVVCALYFPTLFALAGSVAARSFVGGAPPADVPPADEQVAEGDRRGAISVTGASYSLAASALICAASVTAARRLGLAGADIPIITAAVVALATLFPKQVGALAPAAEGLATLLLQIFFAVVGAAGSLRVMLSTAPSLFFFSLLQVSCHLVFILLAGRACGFNLPELLLASNANVGGPTTAAGMATAKGWRSLLVPAILMGILGYATATFLAIAGYEWAVRTWA